MSSSTAAPAADAPPRTEQEIEAFNLRLIADVGMDEHLHPATMAEMARYAAREHAREEKRIRDLEARKVEAAAAMMSPQELRQRRAEEKAEVEAMVRRDYAHRRAACKTPQERMKLEIERRHGRKPNPTVRRKLNDQKRAEMEQMIQETNEYVRKFPTKSQAEKDYIEKVKTLRIEQLIKWTPLGEAGNMHRRIERCKSVMQLVRYHAPLFYERVVELYKNGFPCMRPTKAVEAQAAVAATDTSAAVEAVPARDAVLRHPPGTPFIVYIEVPPESTFDHLYAWDTEAAVSRIMTVDDLRYELDTGLVRGSLCGSFNVAEMKNITKAVATHDPVEDQEFMVMLIVQCDTWRHGEDVDAAVRHVWGPVHHRDDVACIAAAGPRPECPVLCGHCRAICLREATRLPVCCAMDCVSVHMCSEQCKAAHRRRVHSKKAREEREARAASSGTGVLQE